MLFTNLSFFVFFAIAFCAHWSLRDAGLRKAWLLLLSYVFYAAWDWRFLSLILLSTAFDYVAGSQIYKAKTPGLRKLWLILSLTLNLGMLCTFKYLNFFIDSFSSMLSQFGYDGSLGHLNIVLPVGISFYTFQTLSYTIDIYKKQLEPTDSLLNFSLFVAFFPQLVAGPIVRASDFLGQLKVDRNWQSVDVRGFLFLFLSGFVKKACVSDNLAPYVDSFYSNPGAFDVSSSYFAVLAYSVQIYCDFSGYSEMAIGTAGLLGYRLCNNFNFPYFANSIVDFWRRWHISLSTWLRDYLYIPLGGSRGPRWFVARNLMLTMLLGGLWHGASWNFVLWGGLHGVALVALRLKNEMWPASKPTTYLSRLIKNIFGCIATFTWVSIAWIPFRASTFDDSFIVVRNLLGLVNPSAINIVDYRIGTLFVLLLLLLLTHWTNYRTASLSSLWRRLPPVPFSILYGICVSLALFFRSMETTPFIYFQF